jgi:integrase
LQKIRYLSVKDWERLQGQAMPERDLLILRVIYETGCTVNELVNIRAGHCDLAANTIKIRSEHARNHEQRVCVISDNLSRRLRSIISQDESSYLFSTRQSASMTTKRVNQLVGKYCDIIGVKSAGPQVLRYTHIVHAYLRGIPLDAIRKQVGLKRSRAIEIFQELPVLETKDAYRRFIE